MIPSDILGALFLALLEARPTLSFLNRSDRSVVAAGLAVEATKGLSKCQSAPEINNFRLK